VRFWFLTCACLSLLASAQRQRPPAPPPEPDEVEEAAEPEYSFNPIEAQKEIQIGNFYFKKGSYRAAAGRYERATKWHPNLPEAYYKLGDARARIDQPGAAAQAFRKFLELAPAGGRAGEVKKKIQQLEKKTAKPDDAPGPRSPAPKP